MPIDPSYPQPLDNQYTGSVSSDKNLEAPQGMDNQFGKSALAGGGDLSGGGIVTTGMEGDVTDGADLEKGYLAIGDDLVNRPPNMPREGDGEPVPLEERQGFLGRSAGWER